MSAIGDPLDKVAGLDQFQPTLTKRGGKGSVVFEGVTYSRMEWIMRSARLGHTLAAGEGQLLVEEIERLRALVASAYDEGQGNRVLGHHQEFLIDIPWRDSDACKALGGA